MTDLYLGILIVAGVSAVMLVAGLKLGQIGSRRNPALFLMLSILLMLVYQKYVADQLWLTRLLPFSNVVILGNFFPPLAALTAGLAWRLIPGGLARRSILLLPLIALSWAGPARLVFGKPPTLLDRWRDGVCLQSSNDSCSAAAAATLLNAYHIDTSEQEMARLCLTRASGQYMDGGTSMLGLYRGLKLKTAHTPWTVQAFNSSLEQLLSRMLHPVILSVGLAVDDPGKNLPEYESWQPGMKHTVVLFDFFPTGDARMGDPDPEVGVENWTRSELRTLWHGEGIALLPR